jgi:hypothetical protein
MIDQLLIEFNVYLWYILFIILLVTYLVIQFRVKNKKKYLLFFISGMMLGFYFDLVSFINGYYSYPGFYTIKILNIPLSMTIAEGCSVVITIYLFEFLTEYFVKKKISTRNVP